MQQITKEWATESATVLQRTAEGLLNAREDSLKEVVKERSLVVASGITITGIATLVGTAGTGTAISALSGAAAQSALLAWFGFGSLAAGAVILPLVVGGGGYLAYRVLRGKVRKPSELNKEETAIFNRCMGFAPVLLNKADSGGEDLSLSPEDIGNLKSLADDIKKYLRGKSCQSRHVRKKTEKHHGELSKLLGDLG